MSQNLHRSGNRPQWEEITTSKPNLWQKLAAWSGGIIAPANVVTGAGLWLFCGGINDFTSGNRAKGMIKMAIGYGCDVGDGAVAELTRTKSPLGEVLDAGADKLRAAASLLILNSSGDIPTPAAQIMGARAVAMTGFTALARSQGVNTHSDLAGKHATFAESSAVMLYAGATLAEESGHAAVAPWLRRAGHLAVGAVVIKGVESIVGMAKAALVVPAA